MRQFLLAILVAIAALVGQQATAQTIDDPIAWTRGFADRLVTQGGQAAYDYWAGPTRANFTTEVQLQFRTVLTETAPAPGAVRRLSAMTQERADDRTVRVRTLYHLGANPFMITFYFYRPDDSWRVFSWATTNQASEMPFGPPTVVPVTPPPAPVPAPAPAPAPPSRPSK